MNRVQKMDGRGLVPAGLGRSQLMIFLTLNLKSADGVTLIRDAKKILFGLRTISSGFDN
jgi:hypothetical protein